VSVVARWFKDKRGIENETLTAFGVTIEDENEVVGLPYPGAVKYRKGLEKEGRRFWWDPPSMHGQALFTPPDAKQISKMILVEGETDTMALWQHAPEGARPGIRGLPGVESWKTHFADEFAEASLVFVILDNDDPYENADAAATVERGWQKISADLGRKVRRVRLPQGVNDVAEFLQLYSWAALKVLLDASEEVQLPYKRLVLSSEPVEYDWYVKDLLVKSEIVMLSADPGTGKSWIAMALALATLGILPDWLGMEVLRKGPVVFVDQENPEHTARRRLQQLGLTDDHQDMHYLWYQGVRLDEQPERLHEYVRLVEPALVVVDSISRVHFKNENSAEEMNPLMNGGVYPLARQLGANVVLIHHLNKAGGYRGSTAIPAAVDLGLALTKNDQGRINMRPDKLRSIPAWGESVEIVLEDDDDKVLVKRHVEEEIY